MIINNCEITDEEFKVILGRVFSQVVRTDRLLFKLENYEMYLDELVEKIVEIEPDAFNLKHEQ